MTAPAASISTQASTGGASELAVLPALREWETRVFEGVRLSPQDRALASRLGDEGEGRVQIEELREGLRIRARSWIGVIRLETVEIRIVPKLTGDHLGLVQLLEFASGLEGLRRLNAKAAVDVAGANLLDLVALLFAEATEWVVRRGLLAGYVEREDDLRVVRGRILADRQILERFGQLDGVICRFDELEHDVDENRLLVAALRVAARRVRTPSVHHRLGRLRAILEPICDADLLDLRELRRSLSYNRLNSHYQSAHDLAWMVLDVLGIDDILTSGSTRAFAFLLDMNLLFERFVERFFVSVLDPHGFRVHSQVVHSSIIWNAATEKPYSRVIPDLVVRRVGNSQARLVIDAKYKLYDQRRVDPSDIYQTFLYAYALSSKASRSPATQGGLPTAVLAYPASISDNREFHFEVRPLRERAGARVLAIGLPIPAALAEIRSRSGGPVSDKILSLVSELLP